MNYADDYLLFVRRAPDITLEVTCEQMILEYRRALVKGEPILVNVNGWHGKAYVTSIFPLGASMTLAKITLRPTGEPIGSVQCNIEITVVDAMKRAIERATTKAAADRYIAAMYCCDGEDNCRCSPAAITKEKPVLKKFYVGRPDVVEGAYNTWGKDTLPEAIEHAKELARTTGRPQYVVKVIKVVAKQETPVTVRDIK